MILQVATAYAEVDDRIRARAAPRVDLALFGAASHDPVDLRLRWVSADALVAPAYLDGEPGTAGQFEVRGDELKVAGLDDPYAAEAALKLAFQVIALRAGGILLHAASVRIAGRGVLIVGPSGAGKSTLARLCRDSGATLLSDETICVLGSMLLGTPFKSDDDLPGTNERATLDAILVLEKGADESFAAVPPHQGAGLILSQAYRPPRDEVSPSELLRRASLLAERPGVTRFRFRKSPDAAEALRRWLDDRQGSRDRG